MGLEGGLVGVLALRVAGGELVAQRVEEGRLAGGEELAGAQRAGVEGDDDRVGVGRQRGNGGLSERSSKVPSAARVTRLR